MARSPTKRFDRVGRGIVGWGVGWMAWVWLSFVTVVRSADTLWSLRPLSHPSVPATDSHWPRNAVDHFVLSKLLESKMNPSGPADRRTLLRRVSFDLTGLAPTPEEAELFEKEDGPEAFGKVVERLLGSPRYGERWGRHWLDLARYSDMKGYVYDREERRFVHAPAYRDWVIQAFNRDLAYDRFLLLQIAADQLVPADSPDLVAMGFVTGGRRFIGVTHDIIDDRIDVVTRGTMGLTVQCARCHDHKYDPISTRDYYSLYGVFHGCDDELVPIGKSDDAELEKRRRKLDATMLKRREEAGVRLRERVGEYLEAQFELQKYPEEGFDQILAPEDLIPGSVRRWRDFLNRKDGQYDSIFGPWRVLYSLADSEYPKRAGETIERMRLSGDLNPMVAAAFERAPVSGREMARRYGAMFLAVEKGTNGAGAGELRSFLRDPLGPAVVPDTGIVNNELYFTFTATEEIWRLQGNVDRRLIELGSPAALILKDRPPQPNPRVFKRGSPAALGEEVSRRFLSALPGVSDEEFRQGSGRLELARAIVNPGNPLTARVMVNRIWQHHFGTGLVKTPSDFGKRAEPPSHPELLDWLANRFMESGWSIKAMHRLIVLSATYRQSSEGSVSDGDPENRLLSRFPTRRLEFESVRDAMLQAGGQLNHRPGGMPRNLVDPENVHRTVYSLVDRQFLPGTFRTFDFANPDLHVAVRHETTVPQQALYFLNGDFAAARARELAQRTAHLPATRRIHELHRILFQRVATGEEVSRAVEFISGAGDTVVPETPPVKISAWSYGTGEYDESRHRTADFVPLPYFTGTSWQGAAMLPGGITGWAQLTAEGGHPGNTRKQACIRRWTAPRSGSVSIGGKLKHEPEAGDGVRAFVVSSRRGELLSAKVHHSSKEMKVETLDVEAGETIDFAVDIGDKLDSDQFLWAPVIRGMDRVWEAKQEFDGPRKIIPPLNGWEQYAQVLLLSNEFAFVD